MKMGPKSGFVSKTGATALAFSLLAGNAAAEARCASPQEATALQVAALRQQLMVAALVCHKADSFNRFVTSYQGELQDSDKTLMSFFVRQDAHNGADGYNAYKTRQANGWSLRSLRDPRFCRSAEAAFNVALNRNLPLAELVSERNLPIETGFAICREEALETTEAAAVAPPLPARHRDVPDDVSPAPVNAASDGNDAPDDAARAGDTTQPPRADARGNDGAEYASDASDDRDAYDGGANHARDSYRDAYAPSAYAPHGYGPPAPLRQVQGPDGRWYLLSSDGR